MGLQIIVLLLWTLLSACVAVHCLAQKDLLSQYIAEINVVYSSPFASALEFACTCTVHAVKSRWSQNVGAARLHGQSMQTILNVAASSGPSLPIKSYDVWRM